MSKWLEEISSHFFFNIISLEKYSSADAEIALIGAKNDLKVREVTTEEAKVTWIVIDYMLGICCKARSSNFNVCGMQ